MGPVAMRAGRAIFVAIVMASVAVPLTAFAALPFITDDAGTLGRGASQVELWYEGDTDEETVGGSTVKTGVNLPGATYGYGVAETLDLTLGFARSWGTVTVDGISSNDNGAAVFELNAKWRYYENAGFRFAVKPLARFLYHVGGTSDDHVTSYGGWFIATKEFEVLAVNLNAGYLYFDHHSAAERESSRSGIWSLSALATYEVLAGLKLGLDVGAHTNPDKGSGNVPVYAEAGAIYSPNKTVDLSLGLKIGVTKPEPDFAWIAGGTFRF